MPAAFRLNLSLPLTRCGGVGGLSLRLMRLRASNPALIPNLLELLRSRVDVVAEEISDDEVDVSLLGSYNSDAMHMELYLRVRAWEAVHRLRARALVLPSASCVAHGQLVADRARGRSMHASDGSAETA